MLKCCHGRMTRGAVFAVVLGVLSGCDERSSFDAWTEKIGTVFSPAVGDKIPDRTGVPYETYAAIAHTVLGGDPTRGRQAINAYGCGSCHRIPGIRAARGVVGPGLDGFAERTYIAGILPNRPDNLVHWLIDPPRYAPDTAMPDMGIPLETAKDMAAYLYGETGR